MQTSSPFLTHIGGERRSADASGCVVVCHAGAQAGNRGGKIHGGLLASLLDSAMGGAVIATLEPGQVTATASMNVSFIRPGELDTELIATGRVVRRGNNIAFAEGAVRIAGSHDSIATATGTFAIISTP